MSNYSLTTPLPPYRGLILDMDGVLLDSEPLHFQACCQVLAEYGADLTWEVYREYIGTDAVSTFAGFKRTYELSGTPQAFIDRYDTFVLEILSGGITPLPGAVQLVAEATRRKLPLGLASSSLRACVEATLNGLGVHKAFHAVVSGEMVQRGKPAPDIYLLAAKQIGVAPERCVVVEDSPAGVAAARAAGMYVIGVRTESVPAAEIAAADVVLETLEQFDWRLFGES